MDLSGTWPALPADEALRRRFAEPDLDDRNWEPIRVPGHWRSSPAFADADGPLFLRRRFDAPAPAEDERAWLTFDGVFYQSDVWLDGGYSGDTEGYFAGHSLEVTAPLRARSDHTLAVEVTCDPQRDPAARRNLTGLLQGGPGIDPDWNPGGIWRPVRLERTGPLRMRRTAIACTDATEGRALVRIRLSADTTEAGPVTFRTTVGTDHEHLEPTVLAAGENQLEWTVVVPTPRLWWPRALGDQPLTDVSVEARLPGGVVSHRVTRRMGFRSVRLRNWILSVNGERLFAKGASLSPTRRALAEATAAEVTGDVDLAVDAGLDLVRLPAHVARPELYDRADEVGVLVWQDLPLHGAYARSVKAQAVRQARKMVERLGHHPAVVVWCGHDEPVAAEARGRPSGPRPGGRLLAGMQLPTWNKTVLDRAVRRSLQRADGSRPVVAHSGVWPHPPQFDGTDSHLWFGWHHGDAGDLAGFAATIPRMVRWVGAFGAQAVPDSAGFCEPDRWPDLDWARLERHHALEKAAFDRHVPPAAHPSFAAWRTATQAYQATLIRRQVEHLRRLKYRPTGGFAQFWLTDPQPAVSWSVLDHERVPKAGYAALAAACAPVIVVADRPPAEVASGTTLALDVHVVSDLRTPVSGAEITATLSGPDGVHSWRWGGDVGPDSCQRVGVIEWEAPAAPGGITLDLRLTADGVEATNRYRSRIA